MNVFGSFKDGFSAVLHPGQNTGKKMGVGDALKMYYMFSIIPVILFIVLGAVLVSLLSSFIPFIGAGLGAVGVVGIIVGAILEFWIAIPIGILIQAALYELVGGMILKWFKGGYSATVSAVTYETMAVVGVVWLAFIPVIGEIIVALFGLWSIYVLIAALSNQHKTTKGKAFGVWLIWVIIGIIIFAVIGWGFISLLTGLGGLGSSQATYSIPTYTIPQ
jgi:hypothetical protein